MKHLRRLEKAFLAALLASLLLAVPRAQTPRAQTPRAQTPQAQTPRAAARIVCLVPAVTETLFAVGAGAQVTAVSSFDNYPPEVEKLQRVGALLDPDVERILSLRPDLVVVYGSQTDLRAQLDRAHIPTFVYSHGGLAEVTTTIRAIGDRVGHGPEAARLANDVDRRIAAVHQRVAGLPKVRTLVVFEREPRSLRGIYASGGLGFVDDMIEVAGGVNVFVDVRREAVQATTELILARQPEAIIELRSAVATDDERRLEISTWDRLGALPAVRSHRVHLFADQKMSIAGPRVAEVVEILGRTLHPEAFAH